MSAVGKQSIEALFGDIASRSEPVACGAVAAISCAGAAALVELTVKLAEERLPGNAGLGQAASLIAGLREEALLLAEAERTAYSDAREASDLGMAADTPLRIAQIAADVADAAAGVVGAGDWPFSPDAVAGAVLAEGAATIGALLVAENLTTAPDDPRLQAAQSASNRASQARRSAEGGR
ncbi:MAG: hypothetical protein F2813_03355 [Actinobacteria bacterium]|uniref:Unannotated protein n=1 Tax=freshwater metagenome TaxID=449393 RepID=A0A6J5ZRV0_9ZZZZ|nr:hypothetical protein [Actinomycetota bacterium]